MLLAAAIAGCGGRIEEEDEMPRLPPWHMWGNSQVVEVNHSIAIIQSQTTQLARISYGRPESWNFFFYAQIVDCQSPDDAGEIDVDWNLSIGIGRAQTTIQAFESYVFTWPAAPGPGPIGRTKYSAQVVTPPRDDTASTSNSLIDEFVAQDIQCSAALSFTGGAVPVKKAKVLLNCFFAPITHVRPEWYQGRFPGGEDQGT